jgi:hypothetical protein
MMNEVLVKTDSVDFNFPEPVYQPIEEMSFLSDHEKNIFRAFYDAHEKYLDNRHTGKEKFFFEKARLLLSICFEYQELLKVPFIQKYCFFYGVLPKK